MSKIKHKRGAIATLPTLDVGEIAFTTDTKQIFIGDGTNNMELMKLNKFAMYKAYPTFASGVGSVTITGVTSGSLAMAQWSQNTTHGIYNTTCSTNTVTITTDGDQNGIAGVIILVQLY